ncbi:MAG: non-ribosomal peptide synthetase, partial [Acidimicrobiia bacterium]
ALDPAYPVERLALMLHDSEPRAIVTSTELLGRLPVERDRPCVVLDDPDDRALLSTAPATDPSVALRPAHPAYVIYTSGSAGRPKGVVVPHAGLAKLIVTQTERLGVGPHSRVLQFASPSFDLAFWEMTQALCSGGTLVLVPPECRVGGVELAGYIAETGVTQCALPPSVLSMLPADVALPRGISLLCGTEAVPAMVVGRFAAGRRMFNAYGPTEASVNATLYECPENHRGAVPIGRPDPHVTAYVLDPRLQLLPPGVAGELYLGGEGLARGYLRQPGLSAERFVPDAFGPPGARLYRTGDRVRWNCSGLLEFLGRVDDQVKIRGFRIEPGEIEAALESQPGVATAVVVVRDHAAAPEGPPVRRLVGYVVAAPGAAPDGAELRASLGQRLPSHMVPAAVVVLDALPLTPNNKVDKAALPAPWFRASAAGRAPRDDREAVLCRLFAQILHVEGVTIDDNFFDLGGDSILSIQLVGRARREGIGITPRQVFEEGTVAALVAAGTVSEIIPAESPTERQGLVRATPMVAWLRQVAEVNGGSIEAFNQSELYKVPAGAGREVVVTVVQSLLDRHE